MAPSLGPCERWSAFPPEASVTRRRWSPSATGRRSVGRHLRRVADIPAGILDPPWVGSAAMSDDEHDSGGESTFTVVLAFFANAGIALAKTVVALITGSASMLAESAHSWADTGNEVLLLVADKRSRRPPDETR